jgi:hypothetical protein
MSNRDFMKGACRQCGGHLEFPAEAAGTTIACPHCGQATELTGPVSPKTTSSRGILAAAAAAVCVAIALTAFWFAHQRGGHGTVKPQANPTIQSNIPVLAATAVAVHTNPAAETVTNDFALLPFKLEKTPGSSLVYVTGTLQNLSDRQRFGVKIEFAVFDAQTNAVGKATDYQSVLDPRGEWHFKALVIASKAVSARFEDVTEK